MVKIGTNSNILTVIIGIDGSDPPREILQDVEELVNTEVNKQTDYSFGRDTVTLTVEDNATGPQREVLGGATLYIMKFDISVKRELNQGLVNAAHNTVVDIISDHEFNVTGTATVWDNNMQI